MSFFVGAALCCALPWSSGAAARAASVPFPPDGASIVYKSDGAGMIVQFTPQPLHKYLVMVDFANGTCTQDVYDVTGPDQKAAVETTAVASCEKP